MPESALKAPAATVGERLRDRRKELGLTLKEVADGAGLSVGFISQLERGLAAPSLSSLAGISKVLGIHMSRFLSVPPGDKALTRNAQRAVYAVDAGALSYERLSAVFPGSVLNSVLIHEPPGHRSEPIRHEGEELFFVLDGSLTVEVDGKRTILSAGDSIHFASTRKHSTWNHTTSPTTILHVCTMDVFGDEGRMADLPGNRAGHVVSLDRKRNSPK
jgi:transcriptional regulator with XRE-family HTH domain